MKHSLTERVIALAALFQASTLVNQLARTGTLPQPELTTQLRSLFETSPESTESIYGSRRELELGLRTLIKQLGEEHSRRDMDKTRYSIGVLQLERLLHKKSGGMEKLGEELTGMQQQLQHFDITHNNVVARLGDIYLNHISVLGPRIMVSGENNYLDNTDNANKVRALLLSGIRAAVLWRQCGGSRWQLLFKRRAIVKEAQALLA